MIRGWRVALMCGLGLMVGAISLKDAGAQQTRADSLRADSLRADSLRARQRADSIARQLQDSTLRADSIAKFVADSIARVDTLRFPLPHVDRPPFSDASYTWSKEELLASGAHTLAELIERTPGALGFRTGFLVSPSSATYLGCFRCVRVFLDGVELAPLNHRNGGVADFSELKLWPLSKVSMERGASELRVYLQTAGVERTVPYTRVDIYDGSDQTRVLRGHFARRFRGGQILQLSGEQLGTESRVNSGSGDHTSYLARLGIVKEKWGFDGFVNRTSLARLEQERLDALTPLPAFDGARTDAYMRATIGRPGVGTWLQLVAASMKVKENTAGTGPPPAGEGEPEPPPADTVKSEAQYTLMAGSQVAGFDAQLTARLRSNSGFRSNELSLLASRAIGLSTVSGYLRRDTRDSVMTAEAALLTYPLSFLRLSGAIGAVTSIGGGAESDAGVFGNAELGIRVGNAWISGGVIMRDSLLLAAPVGFDAALIPAEEGSAFGTHARFAGKLWRAIGADVSFMRWDTDGWYRPQTSTRAELYADSWWLTRFPNGTLHLHAGIVHESRSDTRFPSATGTLTAPAHSAISFLLEIRILEAVLTFQTRNIRGEEYSQVPGFVMPRRANIYGIRWILWN